MNVLEAKEVFLSCVDDLSEPLKSAVEFTLANWHKMEREPNELDDLPGEKWRDVVGYEEFYKVSNCGRVKSVRFGKENILNACVSRKGYLQVHLRKNGSGKSFEVHKLVALAFLPKPDGEFEIDHIDGDKSNNRVDNLEWVTHGENLRRAYERGLRFPMSGSHHKLSKLTDDDVRYIRANYIPGHCEFGARPLARRFNVSKSTIERIIYGEAYKNVV